MNSAQLTCTVNVAERTGERWQSKVRFDVSLVHAALDELRGVEQTFATAAVKQLGRLVAQVRR